ncbi:MULTISPECIES: sensor domain-containing diguanylate cyclase [Marinobacter]|uniref:diguanylate cyclase n=1 Tax=Marinobacter sp. MMG032 TaxID=3158548 RepID=A0AAU7MMU6_9GAMM|nr:sensor domain-containing diguanylate cyclase [Marinobacter sp.]MBO6567020.1 sensor domain-containing diguanylate cyclase [Pseudomonadales bacterium]MBO6812136.1 sensor domain-containing diguanylate cyclase [Marinobacter sp.]MBO6873616.1 sensor domain-containing diguanylate cyclase [Marinobacter sp.]|tara:strand:+ start:4073 stop:5086 length:1014 start_codon:yes stop_codon:yes gene_type:complete
MSEKSILDRLTVAVTESSDMEELVRPFLEILEEVTGLESTYLTRIDKDKGRQYIVFSHNTKTHQLNIPEGLSVDWSDTLCKRALDEEKPFSNDVAESWSDSEAACELGIGTYLSEPICLDSGALYGTLCGASGSRVDVSPEAGRLLSLLAKLISRQIERDLLIKQLKRENLAYSTQALSDPLTGIPNRRALFEELSRSLAYRQRSGEELFLAFIDLDGFKGINDQYGHDAGDRFLLQIAQRLTNQLRESDFVARYGGDEFVFVGHAEGRDPAKTCRIIRERIEEATSGTFDLNGESLIYKGASVGVVVSVPGETDREALIARADQEMYRVKQSRKQS